MDFAKAARQIQAHLAGVYKIPIVTRDIPDPLTGDLDGAEIHIDYAVTEENRVFLLAHLFGHTVQWNTDPRKFEIGQLLSPPVAEEPLAEVLAYEQEAARLSLALLHQAGVAELDQWLADMSAADLAYLTHYYRTGEKREFDSFRTITNAPLLSPIPVPPFTPQRRRFRVDGIVI
jgi:hypothetical protein